MPVRLKRVVVENFKSFEHLDVSLNDFNVIIGANASGKTNFLNVFRFIRDIAYHGLENAVSIQGGVEYLFNLQIGLSKPLVFELVFTGSKPLEFSDLIPEDLSYKFSLVYDSTAKKVKVLDEELFQTLVIKSKSKEETGFVKFKRVSDGRFQLDSYHPKIIRERLRDIKAIYEPIFLINNLSSDTLFIQEMRWSFPLGIHPFGLTIKIFDFNPHAIKRAFHISGMANLEEDGSNLPLVLKNVFKRQENRHKLLLYLKDLLPHIKDISVDAFADRSLILNFQEDFTKDKPLPSFLISDGTMKITALLVALLFENSLFVAFEEPISHIHPSLISRIINTMKDFSSKKQILLTTHNPEVVKYAGIENLLLVYRDKKGFSMVSRPSEKEEVKVFLKNEIGIDDLFVNNILT
ncbi:MAG: AAA family ATPase [Chlorobi bacterium]|nr:AAA family ATPase [Chlorobiota bacterium]